MAPLNGKGRVAKDWTLGPIRELTRPELEILKEPRKGNTVQSLKDSHHRVARLCAMGLRRADIVEQSGYGYGRVSALLKDPAFQNLIAEYRKEITASAREQMDEYHSMLTGNMIRAERLIADKLEAAETEEGISIPTRDLIAIARDAADRTGYGKKQTNVNVNVDLAAQLEKARARSARVIPVARAPAIAPTNAPLVQSGQQAQILEPEALTLTSLPAARVVRRV